MFETPDRGQTWTAIGPYWNFGWNFGLPCSANGLDACPKTTHPDQHAVAFGNGTVFFGNDGGIWSRPVPGATGWSDLNATLHTLQYYSASAGPVTGPLAFWGGLQDNGQSLLLPGATTMVSPFAGDGGRTIVDPRDGNNAVVEYVDLDLARTTDGGKSWTEITPSCFPFTYAPIAGCDPRPRFIAPFKADTRNPDHWVAGGSYVWDNGGKGWGRPHRTGRCRRHGRRALDHRDQRRRCHDLRGVVRTMQRIALHPWRFHECRRRLA